MIIFINGTINSGKTTVSKELQDRLIDAVHIEVDDLRNFASFLSLEEVIPHALEDSLSLTKSWVQRGYHVIVSWPISVSHHEQFLDLSRELDVSLLTFTLKVRKEIAMSNRGGRELNSWELNRIEEIYSDSLIPDVGVVIDSSDLSIEKTVNAVLDYVNDITA